MHDRYAYDDEIGWEQASGSPSHRSILLPLVILFIFVAGFFPLKSLVNNWEAKARLGTGPFADLQLPTNVPENKLGEWKLHGFNAEERTLFYRLLASGRKETRPYLRLMAPSVNVHLVDDADSECKNKGSSCLVSVSNNDGTKWNSNILYLRRSHLSADRGGQFLVWHELGHVVDRDGISSQVMADFYYQVEQKQPQWIVNAENNKDLPVEEVWAEQWAMWATNGHTSLTTYNAPDITSDADIMNILNKYEPQLMPYETEWAN